MAACPPVFDVNNFSYQHLVDPPMNKLQQKLLALLLVFIETQIQQHVP